MPKVPKVRVHREWFRPVLRGNRKSCPNCKVKLGDGESVWCWGEYVCSKWRNVQDFCRSCWHEITLKLLQHKQECGCSFELEAYRSFLPKWLSLGESCGQEESCILSNTTKSGGEQPTDGSVSTMQGAIHQASLK